MSDSCTPKDVLFALFSLYNRYNLLQDLTVELEFIHTDSWKMLCHIQGSVLRSGAGARQLGTW